MERENNRGETEMEKDRDGRDRDGQRQIWGERGG